MGQRKAGSSVGRRIGLEHNNSKAARRRVGGDEKAKVRRGLYLLGGGLASITETNNRSKADSFLFPIEIQLEVWGAAPLLHEVTQGPRFLSACCSKEMFFFHVTKTDLSPPHTTSHLVAKGKRTRGSGLLRT